MVLCYLHICINDENGDLVDTIFSSEIEETVEFKEGYIVKSYDNFVLEKKK